MQCPRCGSGVAAEKTECPICGAVLPPPEQRPGAPRGLTAPVAPSGPPPLQTDEPVAGIPGLPLNPEEAPSPNYLQPNYLQPGQPGAPSTGSLRVSLTGETHEAPAPSRTVGLNGSDPIPRRPVERERAPAKFGTGAIVAVVLLILVLAGGAAGWWYWQKQHAPAQTVDRFFEAVQKKDWKTVYNMLEFPEGQKKVSEDQFTMVMGTLGSLFVIKEYKIDKVETNGDTASVTVTVTTGVGGKSTTQTAPVPLKRVNGVWKLDAAPGKGGLPGFSP